MRVLEKGRKFAESEQYMSSTVSLDFAEDFTRDDTANQMYSSPVDTREGAKPIGNGMVFVRNPEGGNGDHHKRHSRGLHASTPAPGR